MKIQALQAIGNYKVGDVIEVVNDSDYANLVKNNQVALSKKRADFFVSQAVAIWIDESEAQPSPQTVANGETTTTELTPTPRKKAKSL